MSHALVLTANPARRALSAKCAYEASQASSGSPPVWLAEGVACEIRLNPGRGLGPALAAARAALAGAPIDCNMVAFAHRRKRLLVADMDSTMIEQECIDEIGDLLAIKPKIAEITDQAMRGDIAFETALYKRVALLKGASRARIAALLETRITEMPGAHALVHTMRANGGFTALVSGGFTLFAEEVGRRIGFDEVHANTLLFNGETLTGAVAEPVFGPAGKLHTLLDLRERLGLEDDEVLAVGDGANDIDMLRAAGLGVAYRAKPKVIDLAAAHIEHGDLTALLYLQGYREDEFVTA